MKAAASRSISFMARVQTELYGSFSRDPAIMPSAKVNRSVHILPIAFRWKISSLEFF
jgi:hypothetical protein